MYCPIFWTIVVLGLVLPPLWIVALFMHLTERMNRKYGERPGAPICSRT